MQGPWEVNRSLGHCSKQGLMGKYWGKVLWNIDFIESNTGRWWVLFSQVILEARPFYPTKAFAASVHSQESKKHLKVKLTFLAAATVWIWFGCVPWKAMCWAWLHSVATWHTPCTGSLVSALSLLPGKLIEELQVAWTSPSPTAANSKSGRNPHYLPLLSPTANSSF